MKKIVSDWGSLLTKWWSGGRDKFAHPGLVVLVVIFALWYLPQTFLMNESVETIAAFEIDHSLMIETVFSYLTEYNLLTGYMSRYYGWSYFFVNFVILKPIFLLHGVIDVSLSIFLVKLVYFLISLVSVIALYALVQKIFHRKLVSFLATSLYLFPSLKPILFAEIKPETTGLGCFFLAGIFLLQMIEDKNKQKVKLWGSYILLVVFLTLSVLAKQTFVFAAIPMMIIVCGAWAQKKQMTLWQLSRDLQSQKILCWTLVGGLVICLIVMPQAFLHPRSFWQGQSQLLADHNNSALTIGGWQLATAWTRAVTKNNFLLISLISWLPTLYLVMKNKNEPGRIFILGFLWSLPVVMLVTLSGARLFISTAYLIPMYLFFILPIAYLINYICKNQNRLVKLVGMMIGGYLLFLVLSENIYHVAVVMQNRRDYKSSEVYQVHNYIKNNLPRGSKIAVSQGVLIPKFVDGQPEFQTCDWWDSCNSWSALINFRPDSMIFIGDESYNGVVPEYAKNYQTYVTQEGFRQIGQIGKFVIFAR